MSTTNFSTGSAQQGEHVVPPPRPGDRIAHALAASYNLDDPLPDDWIMLLAQLDAVTRCPQSR